MMSRNLLVGAAILAATLSVAYAGGCAAQKDCKSCLSTPFCGWCSESQSCMEGTPMGPLMGKCEDPWEPGLQLWGYDNCVYERANFLNVDDD